MPGLFSISVVVMRSQMSLGVFAQRTQTHGLRAGLYGNSACISTSTAALSNAASTYTAKRQQAPKPFSEIPGPKGLPLVGNMFSTVFGALLKNQTHIYMMKQHEKYGPICKETLGPGFTSVSISDPDDVDHLLRNDGKYPRRMAVTPWSDYRKLRGKDMGVLLSEGEDWQRVRTAVNPHLLRPTTVNLHTEELDEVVQTLMERLEEDVTENSTPPDLRSLLAKWAMEAVSLVLFEKRIGSLDRNPPENCMRLFRAMKAIQSSTIPLMLIPPPLVKALNLKIWKEHVENWDTVFEITNTYCSPVIERVQRALESGEEANSFIATMLKSGALSQNEIDVNLSDFLVAGIDTTATTASWVLVYLANNPDEQELLYREISSIIPSDGGRITQEQLSKLRYLKAVVKETLRLRPIVFGISRELDDEIILGGYRIPPKTFINVPVFAMSTSGDQFDEPLTFRPERWIRGGTREDIHPFSSVPFGHGPRGCIGRRLAELELYLLLSRIVQKYSLESTGPVAAQATSVLEPKGQLNVKFHRRNE